MMYGDCGHGSIVLMIGIYLCMTYKKEAENPVGDFRYFLLLCGFFSTYCGLCYNEWFALPLNIFTSCYELGNTEESKGSIPLQWQPSQSTKPDGAWYYPRKDYDCVVAWGYDPVWGLTSNNLSQSNSIKMKMSVIFGVLHMFMGIIHKGLNGIYFRQWAVVIVEAIGGSCILLFWFGFMDLMIFCKWFTHINIYDTTRVTPSDPTSDYANDVKSFHMKSCINVVINTFFHGAQPATPDEIGYLGSVETQYHISGALAAIAIIIIPFYLLVIPCCFRNPNKPKKIYDDGGEIDQVENMEPNLSNEGGNLPINHDNSGRNSGDIDGSNQLIQKQKGNIKSLQK